MLATQTNNRDPLEEEIENIMQPGDYIDSYNTDSFVEELKNITEKIAAFVEAEPRRAASLCEALIAGCYEKIEEVDDSDGDLGNFGESVFCLWIEALQAAQENPEKIIEQLFKWIEQDDYGFCSYLEREVVKILNPQGLVAFEKIARQRFEESLQKENISNTKSYGFKQSAEILKDILAAQKNITGYLEICKETELAPKDGIAIAGIYETQQQYELALEWIEKGLDISFHMSHSSEDSQLSSLKLRLLQTLNRNADAVAFAWQCFQQQVSVYRYEDLLKYAPEGERLHWRQQALDYAQQIDIKTIISFYVKAEAWGELAERLTSVSIQEFIAMSHFTTEPAAKGLSTHYPAVAAKLYQALAMRIVNAGKSTYYTEALENFWQAKICYERAGLVNDWQSLVSEVRKNHSRKRGIIPGFELIVKGESQTPKVPELSFIDKAKKRFQARTA